MGAFAFFADALPDALSGAFSDPQSGDTMPSSDSSASLDSSSDSEHENGISVGSVHMSVNNNMYPNDGNDDSFVSNNSDLYN